ncbi:MAG: hypothetical protein UW91_C0006G0008 [Parcubacteria group bacterium GW2011_GWF2_45_11]|nr:MAG: hypothetical protein UW91_C0006G0008 [Parcubacteria group bacterium GW2011_GWF2_45_11]
MELGEPKLEPRESEIATTYIDLTRHGNRFGGKMKVEVGGQAYEFDDEESLTLRGRDGSKDFGANYPDDITLVHPRGEKERHGQTGEDIVSGSHRFGFSTSGDLRPVAAPVMSQVEPGTVKGSRRGLGLDYKTSGMSMELLRRVKDVIKNELNKIVSSLTPEQQEEFIKPENKELRAKYREQAQIAGLKEAMEDDEATGIAAENEALELMHIMKLFRRGVKVDKVAAIPNVGSGMFAESLFKYALVVEDLETGEKKVGFDDVDEIGGFTKQATAFRIIAKRDLSKGLENKDLEHLEDDTRFEYQFTDPERAEFFKGKKVYLDWDKVRELAKKAEVRFKPQDEEPK